MASAAVHRAVRAFLEASPIPGWPFRWPNPVTGEAPLDASCFITVEFRTARSDQLTWGAPGDNVFRETGTVLLVLAAPRGVALDAPIGADPAPLDVADGLRARLRNAAFGGVRTFEADPAGTDPSAGDGNYYRLPVSVPYRFDFTG